MPFYYLIYTNFKILVGFEELVVNYIDAIGTLLLRVE